MRRRTIFSALLFCALWAVDLRADQIKQSTTYARDFQMVDSADHLAGKTGATVSCTLSKAGGTFAAAGGSITELSNGWYKLALTTTDTNTLNNLAYHCTATGADPSDFSDQIVAVDPTDAVAFGLSRMDAAISSRMATFTLPANFSTLVIDANGRVSVRTGLIRNVALSNFDFEVTDSTTHAPKTGLVNANFTKQYLLDSGSFLSLGGTITEVTSGLYRINLAAGETNGAVVAYRFAASGADDVVMVFLTSP